MKALLWDMDGTLVDSEPLWGIATYELAERMGRPLTPEVRARTVGGTTPSTVKICAEHAGLTLDDATLQHYLQWMYGRVAELLATQLPFRPGVQRLLAEATGSDRPVPMALVTNTTRSLTDVSLRSIGAERFAFTLCGNEVPAGKPAPDIYVEAARRIGATPDECLVLEDSTTGMLAAHRAGCRVLGVPTEESVEIPSGVHTLSELRPGVRDLGHITLGELAELHSELGAKRHGGLGGEERPEVYPEANTEQGEPKRAGNPGA